MSSVPSEVRAARLFTNPKAKLQVKKSIIPALKPDALKGFLKRAAKEKPLGELTLASKRSVLPRGEIEEAGIDFRGFGNFGSLV